NRELNAAQEVLESSVKSMILRRIAEPAPSISILYLVDIIAVSAEAKPPAGISGTIIFWHIFCPVYSRCFQDYLLAHSLARGDGYKMPHHRQKIRTTITIIVSG
ncbi:MAG: hypothetical protein WD601_04770, partial [Pseudohongiellaceae bacterium]